VDIRTTLEVFRQAAPEELRDVFGQLARVFSAKAEEIYDKDPHNNGLLAQPFGDLADLMGEASFVFEDSAATPAPSDLDSAPRAPQPPPTTVSAVVARQSTNKSWGKW